MPNWPRGCCRIFFALLLVACTPHVSSSLLPAGGNDLAVPPEVESVQGVARFALATAIDPYTGGPTFMYDNAMIAPTIRVSPGDTIVVDETDDLPVAVGGSPMNMANLHFHGLTVSPAPPQDDVLDMLAAPGQTLRYAVNIPASTPPGLYWYHPHTHGESDWQVFNGMSGAIVVNGIAALAPETAGLRERIIILRNVLNHPDFSSFLTLRRSAATKYAQGVGTASTICSQPFDQDERTTINGQNVGGPILIQPGERQFWRVVNASADGYYDLSVDGEQLRLIAIDGVPLTIYPGASERNVNDILIPPAGRAEFIVTGPASGTAAFRTTCFDTGSAGDPNPSQVLGILKTGSATELPLVPGPGATPRAHGTYDLPIGTAVAAHRTVIFTEDASGTNFFLNGQAYSPASAPMFTVNSGTVEEWTLENATNEVHAFHIHQIHFVVEDVDGRPQTPFWTDTVNLPYQHADGTPSVSHVLMDFRDPIIRGTFLFHCHILEHEDGGMMAKIEVQ